MSDGRFINDSVLNVKATSSNAVWAVKGTGAAEQSNCKPRGNM